MLVEYAALVSAMALLTATLSGSFGQSVGAVFTSSGAGVTAVAKAARAQKVTPAGAKAAYRRAPYDKPALKYLYALGWVAGAKNRAQCALALLGRDAARRQAERELRSKRALLAQLRRHAIGARVAAKALVDGLVSACA